MRRLRSGQERNVVTLTPCVTGGRRRYVRHDKPHLRRLVGRYCNRDAAVGKMSSQDRQALNILIMERAAIRPHKSHMSRDTGRAARSPDAGNGPRALTTGARGCAGGMRLRGIPSGRCRRVYGGHVGSARDGRPAWGPRGGEDGGRRGAAGRRAGANDAGDGNSAGGASGDRSFAPSNGNPSTGNTVPCIRKGTTGIFHGDRARVSGETGVPGYHGVRAAQTRGTCK